MKFFILNVFKYKSVLIMAYFALISGQSYAGNSIDIKSVNVSNVTAGQSYAFVITGTTANPFINTRGTVVAKVVFVSSAGTAFDISPASVTVNNSTTVTTASVAVPTGAPAGSTYTVTTYWHDGTSYHRNMDNNLCPASKCITVGGGTTEISENSFSKLFILYPNPTKDILNIKSEITAGDYNVKLINVLGIVLKNEDVSSSNFKLDISELPKGSYLLIFENEEQKSKVFRVMKD